MRALLVGLLCLGAAGCYGASLHPTSTPLDFAFSVQNIDGPPVVIMVNGTRVGTTDCADQRGLVLKPGQSGVPPLPWVVALDGRDGTPLESWPIDGSTSYFLFIRRYGPMLEAGPNMNPGPGPMLPCPSLRFDTPQPG